MTRVPGTCAGGAGDGHRAHGGGRVPAQPPAQGPGHLPPRSHGMFCAWLY